MQSPQQLGGGPALENSFNPPGLNNDGNIVCLPPDASLAVGSRHIVAAVNSAFQVYDHEGVPHPQMPSPRSLESFFQGVPGCSGDLFDPGVLYDEEHERFFLGADGNGNTYCFAVSGVNDPTNWCRYSFSANQGNGFFDYPQPGVGDDFIFVGGNNFLSNTAEARIWALRKTTIYSCVDVPFPQHKTLAPGTTPRPMNAHGFSQGSWPSETHYFLTNHGGFQDTEYIGIWSWNGNSSTTPTFISPLDLDHTLTTFKASKPINTPQRYGLPLRPTGLRTQDSDFFNGSIWTTQSISCLSQNRSQVNAIRWAEINPQVPEIIQSGVYWIEDHHVITPNLAVNHCGDMLLGYTRVGTTPTTSLTSVHPSVHFTTLIEGEPMKDYCCAPGNRDFRANKQPPFPWGDYTTATTAPDGEEIWYLGKNSNNQNSRRNYGFAVCRISTGCQSPPIFADGFESGDVSAWTLSAP